MKCIRCGNEFEIKLGSKLISQGCKILTAMIAIITIQCENCGQIFQVPISSKSFFSIKKNKKAK